MAAAKVPVDVCRICLEEVEMMKIVGPCQHAFCKPCLETVINSHDNPNNVFPCPTCQAECVYPDDGVDSLADFLPEENADHARLDEEPSDDDITDVDSLTDDGELLLEKTPDVSREESSKRFFDVPDEEPYELPKKMCLFCHHTNVRTIATMLCEECGDVYLCKECSLAHKTRPATRNHVLTPFGSATRDSAGICKRHGNLMKMYCINCSGPVCGICVEIDHSEHDVCRMKDVDCWSVVGLKTILEEGQNQKGLLEAHGSGVTSLSHTAPSTGPAATGFGSARFGFPAEPQLMEEPECTGQFDLAGRTGSKKGSDSYGESRNMEEYRSMKRSESTEEPQITRSMGSMRASQLTGVFKLTESRFGSNTGFKQNGESESEGFRFAETPVYFPTSTASTNIFGSCSTVTSATSTRMFGSEGFEQIRESESEGLRFAENPVYFPTSTASANMFGSCATVTSATSTRMFGSEGLASKAGILDSFGEYSSQEFKLTESKFGSTTGFEPNLVSKSTRGFRSKGRNAFSKAKSSRSLGRRAHFYTPATKTSSSGFTLGSTSSPYCTTATATSSTKFRSTYSQTPANTPSSTRFTFGSTSYPFYTHATTVSSTAFTFGSTSSKCCTPATTTSSTGFKFEFSSPQLFNTPAITTSSTTGSLRFTTPQGHRAPATTTSGTWLHGSSASPVYTRQSTYGWRKPDRKT